MHGLRVAGEDGEPLDLASPPGMATGSGSQFAVLARRFAEYALADAAVLAEVPLLPAPCS